MTVVTRFAPSPTGYLHIGGARTALFNYLYAKRHRGKFILRVEDTDKARSTLEASEAILRGMQWLGLDHDELHYQSENKKRHVEIAHALLSKGAAYYCYTPQEEINYKREEAQKAGKHYRFHSEWRYKNSKQIPKDRKPVLRIKAPDSGSVVINDIVQGKVEVSGNQLDDMILLRSDGTPTYMLAVVVDDHDMGITHIIRGDDHLNNAFRQYLIYSGMNWQVPIMAHIPLIHGMDGKKLSKRHGAVGLDEYENDYLPEAIFNYLLRLGWSHGDDEVISRKQAIEWFNLESLGKAAAKLDFDKMRNLNSHYIKEADNERLIGLISKEKSVSHSQKAMLMQGLDSLKTRAKTLGELAEGCKIYLQDSPIRKDAQALEIIKNFDQNLTTSYISLLENCADWTEDSIKEITKNFVTEHQLKLGALAQFIRAQITGTTASPSVFEIMAILGKKEVLKRLRN